MVPSIRNPGGYVRKDFDGTGDGAQITFEICPIPGCVRPAAGILLLADAMRSAAEIQRPEKLVSRLCAPPHTTKEIKAIGRPGGMPEQ